MKSFSDPATTINIQINSSTHMNGIEPRQLPEMLKKSHENDRFLWLEKQLFM